jgi:tagaturonate reductase
MLDAPRRLNAALLDRPLRPTPRILQFGGGNFMRAFFDSAVDRMNEDLGTDWGIVIIRSVSEPGEGSLNDQDGLYTMIERGLDEEGREREAVRVVRSVVGELFAGIDWWRILALARNPDIRLVTSNTTDAGLALDRWDLYADTPPRSFPAKLTRLLHERWKFLGGRRGSGWQVLPCELSDRNGETLAMLVRRQAECWALEEDFLDWLAGANSFYNTLVDRIVPGFPHRDAARLRRDLGYDDRYMVVAEPFRLLAVERRKGQPDLLPPLAAHDPATVITDDLAPLRARKVSILNGSHTALCPIALLAGFDTVREAVAAPAGARFLSVLLDTEILPGLDGPPEALRRYGQAVLRRFANPFVEHRWHDIALNALAKFRVRLLPHLLARTAATPAAPSPLIELSLAGWLAFYRGDFAAAKRYPPRDGSNVLERMAAITALDDGSASGPEAMVSAFLSELLFWEVDIDNPARRQSVTALYRRITGAALTPDRLLDIIDSLAAPP